MALPTVYTHILHQREPEVPYSGWTSQNLHGEALWMSVLRQKLRHQTEPPGWVLYHKSLADLITFLSLFQVHISTNHRAERDAEYQALSKSLGMKSFPDPSFYIKSENFENSLNSLVHNTQNISPAILQQMQQLQGGTPNMKMPELSIIKHDSPKMEYAKVDARDPPSSNGSSLQIIPKQNLQNMNLSSNLASCRMEAKNNIDIHEQINMLKNMDFQKLNSSHHMHMVDEDSEDDDNGSPLTPMRHKVGQNSHIPIKRKSLKLKNLKSDQGEEGYQNPSLHHGSDSEEGQLHIANVEASIDTSITTP